MSEATVTMPTMNCDETWADETGHDETTHQHHCGRPPGPHARHICTCTAEMWEERTA